MYSNSFVTLNSIHIRLSCNIDSIIDIEKMLLNNYVLNKTPIFNAKYKLNQYSINGINSNNSIIKISGIWETDNEYGLTFKIYYSYPLINPSVIK